MADPQSQSIAAPAMLFGASPPTNPSIGTFQVGCSGETIIFRPTDAQGNPVSISGVRNTDDVQLLSLAGPTGATTMTLGLGGLVTSPIPLQPLPPLTSFTATASLPSAGTYDLSFSYNYPGTPPSGRACTKTLIQVFDGPTLVGSTTIDQSQYPNSSVDLVVQGVGVFKALGSFTISSGTMTVWISGDAGNGPLLTGLMRVEPHGNTNAALVGYIDPTQATTQAINGNLAGRVAIQMYGTWNGNWVYIAGVWHGFYYALPAGNQATAFPALADVQSAMQALGSVGPGNLTVTAPTNQSLLLHFTGSLAGQAMPTLVVADSAFQVTHDGTLGTSVGGQFPVATVNGNPYPLRATAFAQNKPVVAFHLLQDAPAVQYLSCGQSYFTTPNYPQTVFGVGLNGKVARTTAAGVVGLCPFQGLAGPADFEVSLTWPTGDTTADRLQCMVQDGQGNVLATSAFVDQSQPPKDLQDRGVGWARVAQFHLTAAINTINITLTSAGTAGKHCLIDSIRLARTSPAQSTRIAASDTVLFSAPAGFVTTSNGPLPAVQSLPVQPAGAKRLPPLPPKLRTMKLGVNASGPVYYGPEAFYSNYAIMIKGRIGSVQGPDGYPIKLAPDPSQKTRGASSVIISIPATDAHGAGLGAPNCTAGVWVVQWTSSINVVCQVLPQANTTTVVEDTSRRVTGTTNRRYYQVSVVGSVSPSLNLLVTSTQQNADGTFACDLQNLAIYPPDVDPNNPGYWRPSFLQKLKGLQCFRFMDLFGTNNLSLASYDHFPAKANFPFAYSGRVISVPIVSIGPPTPDGFCEQIHGTVLRVVTAVPHGLTTGFSVGLQTTDGTSLGLVQGNTIDSTTNNTTTTARAAIDPTDNYRGSYCRNLCHVIDATTLQIGIEVYSGPAARMTNTLTPANAIVYAPIALGATIDPSDAADLCALANLEPWINVPWLATDDCVTRLAQTIMAKTPVGVPVHVEYGNEAWNYAFPGFHYANQMNRLAGSTATTAIPFYVSRMGQVHQIFSNVWSQAGRNVNEVRRVCGGQQAYAGGTTTPMIQQALSQGISFDELTVSSYFNNAPMQGAMDDLLTVEQLLDVLALNIGLGGTAGDITGHAQAVASLAAANPQQAWLKSIQIVNYEGGPDVLTTAPMTANLANRNHGVHRDPDFLDLLVYWMATLEDAGVKLFNIFTMYGIGEVDQWGFYEGFNTQPGTGVVALDQANRNDFENLLAVKSETAGALLKWSAMRIPAAPTGTVIRSGLTTIGRPSWSTSAAAS